MAVTQERRRLCREMALQDRRDRAVRDNGCWYDFEPKDKPSVPPRAEPPAIIKTKPVINKPVGKYDQIEGILLGRI